MGLLSRTFETMHRSVVRDRRVEVLAGHLATRFSPEARVLDVGAGDGVIAQELMKLRPDLEITGVDVMVRDDTAIPVTPFDGTTLPFADDRFDDVLFVDVLHHTEDPTVLLREAARVARQALVMKDHLRDGFLAGPTLRFMDWVGNHYEGVVLPYNYWPEARWRAAWRDLGLRDVDFLDRLQLNRPPLSWAFDRRLHFVTRLELATEAPHSS